LAVGVLAGVAGKNAEEDRFAFFGLGDGWFEEFAEFGEEVFAEVGEGGVFLAGGGGACGASRLKSPGCRRRE
jgi:hypothetical protein